MNAIEAMQTGDWGSYFGQLLKPILDADEQYKARDARQATLLSLIARHVKATGDRGHEHKAVWFSFDLFDVVDDYAVAVMTSNVYGTTDTKVCDGDLCDAARDYAAYFARDHFDGVSEVILETDTLENNDGRVFRSFRYEVAQ